MITLRKLIGNINMTKELSNNHRLNSGSNVS